MPLVRSSCQGDPAGGTLVVSIAGGALLWNAERSPAALPSHARGVRVEGVSALQIQAKNATNRVSVGNLEPSSSPASCRIARGTCATCLPASGVTGFDAGKATYRSFAARWWYRPSGDAGLRRTNARCVASGGHFAGSVSASWEHRFRPCALRTLRG
jgi:hypothetical protein